MVQRRAVSGLKRKGSIFAVFASLGLNGNHANLLDARLPGAAKRPFQRRAAKRAAGKSGQQGRFLGLESLVFCFAPRRHVFHLVFLLITTCYAALFPSVRNKKTAMILGRTIAVQRIGGEAGPADCR